MSLPSSLTSNLDHLRSRLTDVIQPVQSYVANVPNAAKGAIIPDSLKRIATLSSTLGVRILSKSYSPWSGVDFFGKDSPKEQFQAARKAPAKDTDSSSSSVGSPKKVSVAKGTRHRSFRDRVGSSVFVKGVEELQEQGTSSSK